MTKPETLDEYLDAIAAALDVPRASFGVSATEDDAPYPWAVYDPETDDIIGAGHTLDEAAADAYATVSAWKQEG